MESLKALAGHHRIYLDTNIIIYAVEAFPPFKAAAQSVFNALSSGTLQGVTSELTLAEVLVKPIRDKLFANQLAYQELLTNGNDLSVIPVERGILIEQPVSAPDHGCNWPMQSTSPQLDESVAPPS